MAKGDLASTDPVPGNLSRILKTLTPEWKVNNRPGTDPEFFVIDFREYLDLHQAIIERAAKNFRTPANETLYLITKALSSGPGHEIAP